MRCTILGVAGTFSAQAEDLTLGAAVSFTGKYSTNGMHTKNGNVPMLAMTHCDSAQVIKKFGKAAEYTLCASQWDRHLSYSDKWFGSANDFAVRFEKEYEYAPPYQAAESAAAVLTFVDAFQRAGSLDTKKVRDALAATDMQTFYGNIKFDSTGKNIAKPMVLYQIQDGQYKVVAPSKWASTKLRHPTPMWDKR